MSEVKTIHIAAAIIRDEEGRLLLVRKRGTQAFMQAGGKIEAGEAPVTALVRELKEELGLAITSEDVRYIGMRDAVAANEPGYRVEAELFDLVLRDPRPIEPAGEIDAVRWVHPAEASCLTLAALTRDHVMEIASGLSLHG